MRLAWRIEVAARDRLPELVHLRLKSAPRIEVPIERAAERVLSVACDFSLSTRICALRSCSWSEAILGAYFCRKAATCSSRSSRARCARRTRKSDWLSPADDVCLSGGHFQSWSLRLR